MPQIILGIDVGSYSVKVAELTRSFKQYAWTNFYERRIVYNDVLTPEESRAVALQGVLEDNALTWDAAYVALPGQVISSRVIDLPFGNLKKIEQTLPFEIEGYLPFDLDTVVYAAHIVRSTKDEARVLTLYTLKSHVAAALTFLNNAGVEPRRLCAAGAELPSLIHIGLVPPDAPYAIVDIGHEQTMIAIGDGEAFAFTRTLAIGGRHLTQRIAQAVNVPEDEAERLKIDIGQLQAHGERPPEGTMVRKVADALTEVIQELALELRQTFFAFRHQNGRMVAGLYLCGGTARLAGIDDYLSHALTLTVTLLDCHEFAFARVDRADAPAPVAAAAVALALRAVAPATLPSIDFRQGEFVFRANTQQWSGRVKQAIAAGAVLCALGAGYSVMRWYALAGELASTNQSIVQAVTQVLPKKDKMPTDATPAVRQLQAATKELQSKSATLKALLAQSALLPLRRISQAMPARGDATLNVDIFEYTPDQIKIKAVTNSDPEADKIRQALEQRVTAPVEKNKSAEKGAKSTPAAQAADGGEPFVMTVGNVQTVKSGGKDDARTFEILLKPKTVVDAAEKAKKKKSRAAPKEAS